MKTLLSQQGFFPAILRAGGARFGDLSIIKAMRVVRILRLVRVFRAAWWSKHWDFVNCVLIKSDPK